MTDRTPSSSSGDGPPNNGETADTPLDLDALTAEQRDELVSAYLDGEATEQEIALVENHDDLLARADLFATQHDAIATVAPVDDATRDAQIAAALLAVRQPDITLAPSAPTPIDAPDQHRYDLVETEAEPAEAEVVDLSSRRRFPTALVAAAACVIALAIAVPVVLNGAGDDTDTFAEVGAAIDDSDATTFAAEDKSEAGDAPADGGDVAESTEAMADDTESFTTEAMADEDNSDTAATDSTTAPASTQALAAATQYRFVIPADLPTGYANAQAFAEQLEANRASEIADDAGATESDESNTPDPRLARAALLDACPDVEIPNDADVIESVVVFEMQVFGVVDADSVTVYEGATCAETIPNP